MKPLFACLVAALGLVLAAGASGSPIIKLKDGSQIQGDIQSIQDGQYTVVSPSLGTVHVAQSNIVQISYDGGGESRDRAETDAAGIDHVSSQAQQLQAQLAQDPEAMKSILSLQNDPQIQALLNDPQIMQAIQRGDYPSLLNNPKIQALGMVAGFNKLRRELEQ